MRPRTVSRPRMLVLFALVALLGAAVAVLPALAAAPSEAKLEVNENCVQEHWPCWTTTHEICDDRERRDGHIYRPR